MDDIVTRLERIAGDYKTSEFEFLYADYETVCEAAQLIERMRTLIISFKVEELERRGISLGDLLEMMVHGE